MNRCILLGCLALALALGSCTSARRARVALDAARLTRARELGAEQRAPDLFARAEQARKDAEAAPEESPARADHESEARLWLEAAIAEAARLELAEKRVSQERELLAAEQALVQAERQRSEATRKVEALLAANIAREEASRALARASLTPKLRPKLSRAEVTSACDALLARATLVQAALFTLGLDPAKQAQLSKQITDARALLAKDPDAALDRAQAALEHTLTWLGTLRAKAGSPSEAEGLSLAEAMREAGLRVTRGDRGLSGVLDGAFAERTLKAPTRARLSHLCSMARAYPHGAVRAVVASPQAAVASARKSDVQAELSRAGCDTARVGVDVVALHSDDLEFSWLAY